MSTKTSLQYFGLTFVLSGLLLIILPPVLAARAARAPDKVGSGAAIPPLEYGYGCPMGCEHGKLYPKPGVCPVCKMGLVAFRGGRFAHTDHTPKHGGIFFMAPDQWHHLEGVLVGSNEIRIYLYDNFTQPLTDVGPYRGELKVESLKAPASEDSVPMTVPLRPFAGQSYLVATLRDPVDPPYQTEARVWFPNGSEELFNFYFKP